MRTGRCAGRVLSVAGKTPLVSGLGHGAKKMEQSSANARRKHRSRVVGARFSVSLSLWSEFAQTDINPRNVGCLQWRRQKRFGLDEPR